MKRIIAAMAVAAAALAGAMLPGVVPAADAPTDRVVAMYFHRTQRCPTCVRMGTYSEEAVNSGFAAEIQQGKVAFYAIDFQDPRNQALTEGYGVSGPALIVAKIAGDKVAEYHNLSEIWAKSRDKTAFIEYVQGNVKTLLK